MLEIEQAVRTSPRSAARTAPALAAPRRAAPTLAASTPRRAALAAAPANRLARSEARLLALAVMGTVIVCGLLVLYVAAYARVSSLGMEQSRRQLRLREVTQTNLILRAKLAALRNPKDIAAAAQKQGMTRTMSSADYLVNSQATSNSVDTGSRQSRRFFRQDADIQVATRGKADNNSAASSNH